MTSNKFSSVEEYLGALDSAKGNTLREVIDLILNNFPQLEVKLAWNVPQICRGRDYVFGVSALKNHLSLAPWSNEVMETFRPTLESNGYVVKKNLFQVPVDWTVDSVLLIEMVNARITELDER